jgi:hypothetical protein
LLKLSHYIVLQERFVAGDQYRPSMNNHAHLTSQRTYEAYPERANLYQLVFNHSPTKLYLFEEECLGKTRERVQFTPAEGAMYIVPVISDIRRALQHSLLAHLRNAGYKVKDRFPQVIDTTVNYVPEWKFLRISPAFNLRIMHFGGSYWLCMDHQLIVRSRVSLATIEKLTSALRMNPSQRMWFRNGDIWSAGKWIASDDTRCNIALPDGSTVLSAKQYVIPKLTRTQIAVLAPTFGINAQEVESVIKRHSFLTIANASRARLDACNAFIQQLAQRVFPLVDGEITLQLEPVSASLRPPHFVVERDFEEPTVAFDHTDRSKRAQDIFSGLTKFGAYEKSTSPLRLLVISTTPRRGMMENLIERLNRGAARYPGAQKTFGSKMTIREHLVCDSVSEYQERIQEFVRSNARRETDLALVYLPKTGDTDDVHHPYFRVKGLLVQEGLASQMVDEATVLRPDFRDLNLALNMYTKAGYAPWVLDEALSDVDLFIGLSSSQIKRNGQIVRMMGYVNVFDSYGRWQFYQGDSTAFSFDDRLRHYSNLIRNSLAAYQDNNGSNLRLVHIHLTKRFSTEERTVIAHAVRSVVPGASIIFVWINSDHILRMYDLSDGSDGRIRRATTLHHTFSHGYLSTTGSNMFNQQSMGTPIPLELSVWADPVDAMPPFHTICQQVLSLTRLNWASSRNFCQEPITTKFAGDIARLMNAFMQDPTFSVNPSLRGTPWFL